MAVAGTLSPITSNGSMIFGTTARRVDGGFLVNGKKIFASLAGHADYYGILCTEAHEGEKLSRRDTLYLGVPANAPGVTVEEVKAKTGAPLAVAPGLAAAAGA